MENSPTVTSWTWQGMWDCRKILEKGLGIKVTKHSIAQIWDDPWVPGIPNFRPTRLVGISQAAQLVRDFIDQETGTWNYSLVRNSFPQEVAKAILKITIPQAEEQDTLVWFPSKTGEFSVKSAYLMENQSKFNTSSRVPREL